MPYIQTSLKALASSFTELTCVCVTKVSVVKWLIGYAYRRVGIVAATFVSTVMQDCCRSLRVSQVCLVSTLLCLHPVVLNAERASNLRERNIYFTDSTVSVIKRNCSLISITPIQDNWRLKILLFSIWVVSHNSSMTDVVGFDNLVRF